MNGVLINGETKFDTDVNPAIHKFIGMFRKPYQMPTSSVMCSCGSILQTMNESREHWQSGHWDIPQYVTIK